MCGMNLRCARDAHVDKCKRSNSSRKYKKIYIYYGGLYPGSGRTLAACLTHVSPGEPVASATVVYWRTGE